MTLVDTNVLLDLVTNDPRWAHWSQHQLEAASLRGPLLINDVIFAELSVGFRRIEELAEVVASARLVLAPMPREALFLAGKAFQRHRAAGGRRGGVPPDFFIGAHAAVAAVPVLTRDLRRYRAHFPTVELVAPEG
jgi:predicted nucleic acid-binding protein